MISRNLLSSSPHRTTEPLRPSQNLSLGTAVQEHFERWDADGDGFLRASEIREALEGGPKKPAEKAALETLRDRKDLLRTGRKLRLLPQKNGVSVSELTKKLEAPGADTDRLQEQFKLEFNLHENSSEQLERAPGSADRPKDLTELVGTRDYFLERYKDFRKRNPEEKAPSYYLDYGLKYFDRFQATKDTFSPETREWIDDTGALFQEKLEAANDPSKNFAQLERDEQAFRRFAYDQHPAAYLESGLSAVPLKERIMIGLTPDLSDIFTVAGIKQAVHTAVKLAAQDLQKILVGKNYSKNS